MSESNFDEKIKALFGGGTAYKSSFNDETVNKTVEPTLDINDDVDVLDKLDFTLQDDNEDAENEAETTDTEPVYEGEVAAEPILDGNEIAEGAKYRTKKVANILNVPEQTLRNITTLFEDHLPKIERTESGQRLFTKADIERLRKIFQLKAEKKMTYDQIKDFIDKDSGKVVIAMTEEEKAAALITAITNQLQLPLQEQFTAMAHLIVDEVREFSRGQQALLEENNVRKDEYAKEIQRLEDKLDERDRQLELLQAELSQLRNENAQNNQLILEKLEKRRFGLFRK